MKPGSIPSILFVFAATVLAPITCFGNAGTISLSPPGVDFGKVPLGTTIKKTFTVTNTGSVSVTLTAIHSTGIEYNVGDIGVPKTLAPQTSATFTVAFSPTVTGTENGVVTVTSTATNTPTATLTGVGAAGTISLNPPGVNFGNVVLGATTKLTFTVTNTGTATVTITAIHSTGIEYNVGGIGVPKAVAPQTSVTFTVTFSPTVAGTKNGVVTVTSTATNTPTATLTGVGVDPTVSLSSQNVNFGSVIDSYVKSGGMTLENSGTGDLVISSSSLTGSMFSISNLTLPLTLAPSQSTNFYVSFHPSSAGSYTGSLKLATNDPANPTAAISLVGSGIHAVILNWTASPSSGVLGYNIYRGTSSGGESSSPLNTAPVNAETYSDLAVGAGARYCYTIKAVGSGGATSPPSSEACATVPTP